MPNLINNPYNMTDLAQNYRRVRLGDSNLGTRRMQFYQVTVYGVSDAFIAGLEEEATRTVQEEGSIDSTDAYEYTASGNNRLLEAITRGVQKTSELYLVGNWDYFQEDPNYLDLIITFAVSADTVESAKEHTAHTGSNPNYQSIEASVNIAVDDFDPQDGYDYIEVIPVEISGSATRPTGGNSLGRNNPLNAAVVMANKALNLAARQTPPKFNKPR